MQILYSLQQTSTLRWTATTVPHAANSLKSTCLKPRQACSAYNLDLSRARSVSLRIALNELYRSNLTFSEFSQLLSVDSPVES